MSFDLIELLALEDEQLLALTLDCVAPVSRHAVCQTLFVRLSVTSQETVVKRILSILPSIPESEISDWKSLFMLVLKGREVDTQITDNTALLCLCESVETEAFALKIFSKATTPELLYACLARIEDHAERKRLILDWIDSAPSGSFDSLFLNCYLYPLLNFCWLSEDELFQCLLDKHSRRNAKFLLQQTVSWSVYWQIVDSVDEYASNLFKNIFPQFGLEEGPRCKHWFVLLCRCLTHENPLVIKHTVSRIVEDKNLADRIVVILSKDPQRLTQFVQLIEAGWVAGFNAVAISKGLANLISGSLHSDSAVTHFVHYTVWEAKTYFPILFCYWTALHQVGVKGADCEKDLHAFLDSKILAFSALVRPCLERLVMGFSPLFRPTPKPQLPAITFALPLNCRNIGDELLEQFEQIRGREIVAFNLFVAKNLPEITDLNTFFCKYLNIATGLVKNRNKENIGVAEIDSLLATAFAPLQMNDDQKIIAERMKFVSLLMEIGLRANPLIGRHGVEFFLIDLKYIVRFGVADVVVPFLTELLIYKEGMNSDEVEGSVMEEGKFARILALEAIAALNDASLSEALVESLVTRVRDLAVPEAGPLPFSQVHRTQLRTFQAICVLVRQTSLTFRKQVLCPVLFNSILRGTNQPDVRDYCEMLAIFVCHCDMTNLSDFVKPVLKDFSLSAQATASFIVVASFFKDTPAEWMTPYLTSNVSYIRGIVQKWVFENFDQKSVSDSTLSNQIAFLSVNKEAVGMRRRLTCVYDEFDPIELLTSGKIFSTCKNSGEFVPSEIFMSAIRQGVHETLVSNWHYTRQQSAPISEDIVVEEGQKNSQRKYRPSAQIGLIFQPATNTRNTTELIVVTCLLDKITNIAGLCRSAEVFGASTLVVSSLSILKDPMFESMAVTAQHWINIVPVSPDGLAQFVQRKKLENYTIVCLEQTHNSIEIQKYKFNQKTVLILGNEKAGVSIDHIHLMDVCVEIPQRGIVRSLNVHVTGAIAMHHYNQTAM